MYPLCKATKMTRSIRPAIEVFAFRQCSLYRYKDNRIAANAEIWACPLGKPHLLWFLSTRGNTPQCDVRSQPLVETHGLALRCGGRSDL